MSFRAICLLALLAACVQTSLAQRHRIRVTLIGDSISYNLEHSAPIEEAAHEVKMVGLTGKTSAFGGFTARNLFNLVNEAQLPSANIVLVQAGTNNLLHHDGDTDGMFRLLHAIRKRYPSSYILVAPVLASKKIPEKERNAWNAQTKVFVSEITRARFLPECKLAPEDYLRDTVHLTQSGYEKLRAMWVRAIRQAERD